MSPFQKSTLLPLLLLAGCAAEAPHPISPITDVHTRQLKYLDAPEAARILHELFTLFATADLRTNTVIYRGPKEQLDVADALLANLDVTHTSGSFIFRYPLRNIPASEVGAFLDKAARSGFFADVADKFPYFIDERQNVITLFGFPLREEQKIKELIDQMDHRPATLPDVHGKESPQ